MNNVSGGLYKIPKLRRLRSIIAGAEIVGRELSRNKRVIKCCAEISRFIPEQVEFYSAGLVDKIISVNEK